MIGQVLAAWLAIQLVSLAGLPLTLWLLRALPDRGYAFAKPFGLLLTGYFAWLAAMLGLARFGVVSLIVSALLACGLGVWAMGGPRLVLTMVRAGLRANWPALLAAEALFLGGMLAVVWMRSHDPTPWGTERPMDFAFFNAIQRSPTFPPSDPWLAGYSINYYYFGYLLMGALALLSSNPPAVAYNLALATIFALTALGVAGLIANMIWLVLGHRTGDRGQGTVAAAGTGQKLKRRPQPRRLGRERSKRRCLTPCPLRCLLCPGSSPCSACCSCWWRAISRGPCRWPWATSGWWRWTAGSLWRRSARRRVASSSSRCPRPHPPTASA